MIIHNSPAFPDSLTTFNTAILEMAGMMHLLERKERQELIKQDFKTVCG